MSNYSKDDTAYITEQYLATPTRETVDKLSLELDKPVKSVIGKLSREGVYRREVYKTKTGETPITKLELVYEVAGILDIDPEKLIGLDKAPKGVLKTLQRGLNDLSGLVMTHDGLDIV